MSQGADYGAKSRWQRIQEQLSHTYRLIIRNDETLKEVGSYKLTLLNTYILLSSVLVVTVLLGIFLVSFTPLRRYVPGYGSGMSSNSELMALYRQVEDLEEELEATRKYSDNVRRLLVGDVQTADEVPQSVSAPVDTMKEKKPSAAEQQLRKEVALEEVGEVAKNTLSSSNYVSRDMPLEQMYFIAPVSGEISAAFGYDKHHFGIDVLAPKNTAIKAALDGYVFLSDWIQETGFTIGIQHANNVITFYKHNSVLLKKVGSFVKAGEAVAIIGNTGELSSGPHLHFELWFKGKPVDPADYISF
ncbi:MAG: M23 family metallopeptidase [Saprospiraceae bacterium]|nr:M23 family metallopeptidase [Saprospiraceae bacterium]